MQALTAAATALEAYFTAIHTRNATLLRTVWHPSASLAGLDASGNLVTNDAEGLFAQVGSGDAHPESFARFDRVLAIEQSSPKTVLAKVQVAVPSSKLADGAPVIFTDFLSLVDFGSDAPRFQIVSKIYSFVGIDAPFEGAGFEDPKATPDAAELAAAAQTYLDGNRGGSKIMGQVVHPEAKIMGLVDGDLNIARCPDFLAMLDAPDWNPGDRPEFDKVLSISKLGPHAAAMNLQIACGGTLYHDHLAMLRVQGKWQILFKTWTAAPLASCEAAKGA